MARTTSIHLQWDSVGKVRHSISGAPLVPPRDNAVEWLLAPSAPLLLAHQFGAMKPSHGLIVSGWVLDTLYYNRYVLMPINSALRGAEIRFIYAGGPAVKVTFHPKHALFANSDSLEEGVRQLLNNYFHYAYSPLDDYLRISVRTTATAAIGMYLDFLSGQCESGAVGRGRDRWSPQFSAFSSEIIAVLSSLYYVAEGGVNEDNEDWARKQTAFLEDNHTKIKAMRDSLLSMMGMY